MRPVAIVGAGGHTRSLINLLEYNSFEITGIFDDSFRESDNEVICGYPLKGEIDACPKDISLVLSVGDNNLRTELYQRFIIRMLEENLFHPKSIVEKRVKFGSSNQIYANVYINSKSEIGNNNIINTGAIIEHEVSIGSNNHIAVNAAICGRVTIGNNCLIGAGAVIIDKISVADNVIIGANSVVIRDILESGVYAGNPVRRVH